MDLKLLKSLTVGETVTVGALLPGLEPNEEAIWKVTNALDATRATEQGNQKFRWVEFRVEFLGVFIGNVRASERENGRIKWENTK